MALCLVLLHSRRGFLLAFCYGLGLYGVGASWVYISISEFGSTSKVLSIFMTSLFVMGLALAFAIPFLLVRPWMKRSLWHVILGFSAILVLGEWTRTWFLTGFPWLYYGYAHIDTWLAGWAPILGVLGISWIQCMTGALMACGLNYLWQHQTLPASLSRCALCSTVLVLALWGGGALLKPIQWTQLSEDTISVGMAQGNISQKRKWDRDYILPTFKIFNGLSEDLWKLDWVIWPEAAIPLFYSEAQGDLESLEEHAKATDTVFITGILYDNYTHASTPRYYNSLVAVGEGSGVTFKTRLVPFGEYVPLEHYLRGLISFFNLPTSILHIGPDYEQGLMAKDVEIGASICYEVVYPDLVAARSENAGVLLTVSNDAWFGDSIGPVQHFEMAQMRALETGRFLIRSTNNGVSGIVDNKGKILVKGGRSTRETIVGEVRSATGKTPFILWRSWPVVIGCMLSLVLLLRCRRPA